MTRQAIVSYPAVSSQSDLHDLRARLAYYFAPVSPDSIVVPVKPWLRNIASVEFRLPEGFDERIRRELFELSESFLSPAVTDQDYSDLLRAADAILIWDVDADTPEEHAGLLESAKAEGRVWRVDPVSTRMEGSFYIEAARALSPITAGEQARARERFGELLADFGGSKSVHLLGSGPSISAAFDYSFEDTVTIGCNTVILNDELLEHTGLDILVFADPIFHFGCSEYAGNFRAALVNRLESHDAFVVVPEKYFRILLHYCPSIAARVIPVPMHGSKLNVDLSSEFRVKPIPNILTLLQLPLGITLGAEHIYLAGYDGRAPDDVGFWKHNPTTQLTDDMSSIRRVHPAFFAIDYEDYYEEHLKTLGQVLRQGERKGASIWSLGNSHIPALKQRSFDGKRSAALPSGELEDVEFLIVSVNPDLRDSWGHFKHYDDVVARTAADSNAKVLTLANRGVGPDVENPWCWPTFVHNSWSVSRENPVVYERQFLDDLVWSLSELSKQIGGSVPIQLFMYVGHWRHVRMLTDAVAPYRNISVFINLFLCHKELQDGAEKGTPSPCAEFVSMFHDSLALADVRLFVDSPQCRDLLEEQSGVSVSVWPMFSVSDLRAVMGEAAGADDDSRVRVYAPGGNSSDKGFDLTVRMASRVGELSDSVEVCIRAADVHEILTEWPELAQVPVKLIKGNLTAEEYARELGAADVLVLPYRRRPFRTRTSALISDGLMLGKPMIAAQGTWGGNLIENFGLGCTFPDGDPDGLMDAVTEVVGSLKHFRDRAREASVTWRKEAHPSRLIDVLRPVAPLVEGEYSDGEESTSAARRVIVSALEAFGLLQLRSNDLSVMASGGGQSGDRNSRDTERTGSEIASLERRAQAAEVRYRRLRSRLVVRIGLKATEFVSRRLPPVVSLWEAAKRRRRAQRLKESHQI